MLRFDHILVPVDFSRDSMAAVSYAVAFAKKLEGPQTVTVLYVMDETRQSGIQTTSTASMGDADDEHEAKKEAMRRLQKVIDQFDPGEEHLQVAVAIGQPASEVICRYAAEHQVDMIVIGSQGKGVALRKLVLGSTSRQVQKTAPCPVLSVKDPATLTTGCD